MKYRTLGKSDLSVSAIGLGTMSWPGCLFGVRDYAATPEDYRAARDMVEAALETGVNLFDTAEGYGRGLAEKMLGAALRDLHGRDRAIVVTKVGPLFEDEQVSGRNCDLSASRILAHCDKSLERLQIDRIDLYLAHWPDPLTPAEEIMGAAAKLKEQGKIRWFGVSNFSNETLDEALQHGMVAANQLPYSLVDRSIDRDRRPFCESHEVGIMAYSPLGKGILGGKYHASHLPPKNDYRHHRPHFAKENLTRNLAIAREVDVAAKALGCSPAQLATAWVIASPGLTLALPGAKSPDQVRANAAAADIEIDAEMMARLDRVSRT